MGLERLLKSPVALKGIASALSRNLSTKPLTDKILKEAGKFLPNNVYEGFLCTKSQFISDFDMTAYVFRHEKTKTEYLHIDRNDSNNVFSVNFRTTPFNSTGLPHILEHNVLCGSEKFPVRDPFFKMLNRSLATFMNAMTGPDYTLYPFSSMNETDYRNLQSIYLDAVFKPNLNYFDFLQEGWRLEHQNLTDKNSEYIFKGVVYNEMKGAFSENSSVIGEKMLNTILPDHTYGYVSGGDPIEIPNLTHKELVEFHQKYYHPSNAKIFSYGNFNLEPTLKFINENYLKNVKSIDSSYSQIPAQKRWSSSKKCHTNCRFDSMGAPIEKQNQLAIGILMNDITNSYETFLINVLTELMIKGPNSYFYKSLIEPNISGGYNQMTGYDAQLKDTMFVIGLQDVAVEDFSKVEEIFDLTIEKAIKNGFDKNHIESVLHNFELQIKHQTPKFGLGLLFNLTPLWNHDGDLIEAMNVSNLFTKLRENLKNKNYLQEKVQEYFKNNNHKVILTMSPDVTFEEKFIASEQELLSKKVSAITNEDKKLIYENGIKLAEKQKATENLEVLPCLQLKDISKEIEKNSVETKIIENTPTQICSVNTNNITYFQGILDCSKLNNEQKLLLPLLTSVFDQFGTTNYNYRDLDQLINMKTSGISFNVHFTENISNPFEYEIGVGFRSYSLHENTEQMLNIINELMTNFKLDDVKRFEMLFENYLSTLSVGIANSGHQYAMHSSSGLITDGSQLKESLFGINHIEKTKKLLKEQKPEEILAKLAEIAKLVFVKENLRCALNVSEENTENVIKKYKNFLNSIPGQNSNNNQGVKWNSSKLLDSVCQHYVMNIPVNYCAKSFMTTSYKSKEFSSLRILAKILSAKYLLPVVREQNGAYGAGAKISTDGIFSYFSYRDPNSVKTLNVFDESNVWFNDYLNKIDDQILFEAKLGVLQQIDCPIGSGEKSMELFKQGITHEIFANHRKEIMSITKSDLENVNEKYLKENESKVVGKVVLGPENTDLLNYSKKWNVFKT